MKLTELYAYLTNEINDENRAVVLRELERHKDAWKFRGNLRLVQATQLEKLLYGNIDDEIAEIDLPFYKLEELKNRFAKLNQEYGYFADESKGADEYVQIFCALNILNIIQRGGYSSSSSDLNLATYKTMVFFGGHDVAETLTNYELFQDKNNLDLTNFFEESTRSLRQGNPQTLSAWQGIIGENNSRRAIHLFYLAPEIELSLGRAPSSYSEAEDAIIMSAQAQAWDQETLKTILQRLQGWQAQAQFVAGLNEHNLELMSTGQLLKFVLKDSQPKLLQRLGRERFQACISGRWDLQQWLSSIHISHISYFFENILGMGFVKQLIDQDDAGFELFVSLSFPKKYDMTEFLQLLDDESLNRYLDTKHSIDCYIAKIKLENRFEFIKRFDRDLLKDHYNGSYQLWGLLSSFPFEQRLEVVRYLFTADEVKSMKGDHYWDNLKSAFMPEDRAKFKAYIYTQDELDMKQVYKNIKKEIIHKDWKLGMFDAVVGTSIGRRQVVVPRPVMDQIHVMWDVRQGDKTYQKGLQDIKHIAKAAYNQESSGVMGALNFFSSKSPAAEYYEKFVDEAKFQSAFGVRKQGS